MPSGEFNEVAERYHRAGLLKEFMEGTAPFLPENGPAECRSCRKEHWTSEICPDCEGKKKNG